MLLTAFTIRLTGLRAAGWLQSANLWIYFKAPVDAKVIKTTGKVKMPKMVVGVYSVTQTER